MHTRHPGVFLWTFMLVAGFVTPSAQEPELNIMSYNIYWGGIDHDPVLGRQNEWLRVIEDYNPDILVLQEANDWLPGEQNLFAAYWDSLNALFPEEPPYDGRIADANSLFNIAFFTRLPILEWNEHRIIVLEGQRESVSFGHVLVHAVLDADGETVHILGTHLRAAWDARDLRELEARAIMTVIHDLPPDDQVWIMGDFNSYSPVDADPNSLTPPDYAGGAPPAETYGWEPIMYLLDDGFRDAIRDLRPLDLEYSKETHAFLPWTPGPICRVDFLLDRQKGLWELLSSSTLVGGWAEIGSDHYPVVATYRRPDVASVPNDNGPQGSGRLYVTPNPFSVPGTVRFILNQTRQVRLDVVATDGRVLATIARETRSGGEHQIVWDGRDRQGHPLPRGTYFLRLITPEVTESRAVVLQ